MDSLQLYKIFIYMEDVWIQVEWIKFGVMYDMDTKRRCGEKLHQINNKHV